MNNKVTQQGVDPVVAQAYRSRRACYYGGMLLIVVSIVLLVSVSSMPVFLGLPGTAWRRFGAIVLGIALVMTFTSWKCPVCNRRLSRFHPNPRFCASCKSQLHD